MPRRTRRRLSAPPPGRRARSTYWKNNTTKCFTTRYGEEVCIKVAKKKGKSRRKMKLAPGSCQRTKVNPRTGCSMVLCRLKRPTKKNPTGYKFEKGSAKCTRGPRRLQGTRSRRRR